MSGEGNLRRNFITWRTWAITLLWGTWALKFQLENLSGRGSWAGKLGYNTKKLGELERNVIRGELGRRS